jgi:hypothetical protein
MASWPSRKRSSCVLLHGGRAAVGDAGDALRAARRKGSTETTGIRFMNKLTHTTSGVSSASPWA